MLNGDVTVSALCKVSRDMAQEEADSALHTVYTQRSEYLARLLTLANIDTSEHLDQTNLRKLNSMLAPT